MVRGRVMAHHNRTPKQYLDELTVTEEVVHNSSQQGQYVRPTPRRGGKKTKRRGGTGLVNPVGLDSSRDFRRGPKSSLLKARIQGTGQPT
jgi:hypothetical protein